jgi:hypothetical protein
MTNQQPQEFDEVKTLWSPKEEVIATLLHRLDVMALFIAGACLGLLGLTMVVAAAIELVKLLAALWSNPDHRWSFAVLGVSIVWLVARRKQL